MPIITVDSETSSWWKYFTAYPAKFLESCNNTYQYVKSMYNNGIELYSNKENFILNKMYQQMGDNNITYVTLAPQFLAKLSGGRMIHRIYAVGKEKYNLKQVADLGESNGDPHARDFLNFATEILSRPTIISYIGREAIKEKNLMRKHMIDKPNANLNPLEKARQVTSRRFKNLVLNWDANESYQNQMTYLGANIIGESVLGIPEIGPEFVPGLRRIGEEFFEFDHKKANLKKHADFLRSMNAKLVSRYAEDIVASNLFIAEETEVNSLTSAEERAAKLIEKNGACHIIPESNLSSTLMAGLAYINQHPEVKAKLTAEHQELNKQTVTLEELRNLPYLDAVYHETLRYLSSVGLVARYSSIYTDLSIKQKDGEITHHRVPPNSLILGLFRPKHFDPAYFPNPEAFDPSRFLNEGSKLKKEVTAFSVGRRECPAQYGYMEIVFKQMILDSLNLTFTFDKPIEQIPVVSLKNYWKQEYKATVQENQAEHMLTFR